MSAAAIVVIPLQVLTAIVLMSTYSSSNDINIGFSNVGRTATPSESAARLGASGIIELASIVGLAFTLAACVKAISEPTSAIRPTSGPRCASDCGACCRCSRSCSSSTSGSSSASSSLIIPGSGALAAWSSLHAGAVIEGRNPFPPWVARAGWCAAAGGPPRGSADRDGHGRRHRRRHRGNPDRDRTGQPPVDRDRVDHRRARKRRLDDHPQPEFPATVITVLSTTCACVHEGLDVELLAEQAGAAGGLAQRPRGGACVHAADGARGGRQAGRAALLAAAARLAARGGERRRAAAQPARSAARRARDPRREPLSPPSVRARCTASYVAIGKLLASPLHAMEQLVNDLAPYIPGGISGVWCCSRSCSRRSRSCSRDAGRARGCAARRPRATSPASRAPLSSSAPRRWPSARGASTTPSGCASAPAWRGSVSVRRSPSPRTTPTWEVARRLHSERFDALAQRFDEIAYGHEPATTIDVESARREWPPIIDAGARQ